MDLRYHVCGLARPSRPRHLTELTCRPSQVPGLGKVSIFTAVPLAATVRALLSDRGLVVALLVQPALRPDAPEPVGSFSTTPAGIVAVTPVAHGPADTSDGKDVAPLWEWLDLTQAGKTARARLVSVSTDPLASVAYDAVNEVLVVFAPKTCTVSIHHPALAALAVPVASPGSVRHHAPQLALLAPSAALPSSANSTITPRTLGHALLASLAAMYDGRLTAVPTVPIPVAGAGAKKDLAAEDYEACCRFATGGGSWGYGGSSADAICFSVSEEVCALVYGSVCVCVSVFGLLLYPFYEGEGGGGYPMCTALNSLLCPRCPHAALTLARWACRLCVAASASLAARAQHSKCNSSWQSMRTWEQPSPSTRALSSPLRRVSLYEVVGDGGRWCEVEGGGTKWCEMVRGGARRCTGRFAWEQRRLARTQTWLDAGRDAVPVCPRHV